MSDLIRVMPAIALRGTTILPDMIVHFDVSREKSVKAVEASMLQDQKVFLVTQRDPENENPGLLDVYKIGTIAVIKQVAKLPKGMSGQNCSALKTTAAFWKLRWRLLTNMI